MQFNTNLGLKELNCGKKKVFENQIENFKKLTITIHNDL